jgi:Holliday junction resolvase
MPGKRHPNARARSLGSRTEALLVTSLIDIGYEVRRTHLSAYPDIIAWNQQEILLIEVKARTTKTGVTQAKSMFKSAAQTLKFVPDNASVLCYVRFNAHWIAYQWDGSKANQVDPIV